jgi:hypothetical protein
MAAMFAGKRATATTNDKVMAWHRELVQEMELEGINSGSSMREVRAFVLRQSDGVIYQLSKNLKGRKERLPNEEVETFLFRVKCQRALNQLARDGVIKITDSNDRN